MRTLHALHFSLLGLSLLSLSLVALAGCSCNEQQVCTSNSQCGGGWICLDGMCTDPTMIPDGGRVEPGCTDLDGDGRGEGCSRGPDCDDSNRDQTGTEVCDGLDNDCDGVPDNGVLSACGNCDMTCMSGGTEPFDPGTEESDSVAVDEDGALVLDSRSVETAFIWIANTAQGTVSKVDTRTMTEVARYATGPAALNAGVFAGNDPSRTSVNSLGDVYVGNRAGQSVTKISVLGARCPDSNGDGVVTTSSGPGDLLPWGQDDCVLWHRSLAGQGLIRGVAAQDEYGPDGELIPSVWLGSWDGRLLTKLEGNTGEILLQIPSPTNTYGLALDGMGNLWISGRDTRNLGRVDTTRCRDSSCGSMPVCGADGDDCVLQAIPIPSGNTYGITVDRNQRIWMAFYDSAQIARYDPTADLGARWQVVSVGANPHGIAADGVGWVWAAVQGSGVVRLNQDNPMEWQVVAGTGGYDNKGMAIDFDGRIWSVCHSNVSLVIEPGGSLDAGSVVGVVDNGQYHYTYSDMTGQQLRLATNPRGWYRRPFQGCDSSSPTIEGTNWGELRWAAEIPAGTSLLWRVRTANSRAELATAAWVLVAEVPPATSPADIGAALNDAGITPGDFLEVEVQLIAERMSATEIISPRLTFMEVTYTCRTSGPG